MPYGGGIPSTNRLSETDQRASTWQQSPISLASDGEFETLLAGKNVSFTVVDGDSAAPEWTRVLLDGAVHLMGMKEVSTPSHRLGVFGFPGVMADDRLFSRVRRRTASSTSLMERSHSNRLWTASSAALCCTISSIL